MEFARPILNSTYREAGKDKYLLSAPESNVFSFDPGLQVKLPDLPKEYAWHLSTPNVPNLLLAQS